MQWDGIIYEIVFALVLLIHKHLCAHEKASDQLQKKFNMHEGKHSERSAANNENVPENPLYWTETIQYDTKGHKRSKDNR